MSVIVEVEPKARACCWLSYISKPEEVTFLLMQSTLWGLGSAETEGNLRPWGGKEEAPIDQPRRDTPFVPISLAGTLSPDPTRGRGRKISGLQECLHAMDRKGLATWGDCVGRSLPVREPTCEGAHLPAWGCVGMSPAVREPTCR